MFNPILYDIRLCHATYIFSRKLLIMSHFQEQEIYLSADFERKARAIFFIPSSHYVSNDELKYYYSILREVQTDDEARLQRVLTCDTNVYCECYACSQRDDTSLDTSHASLGGHEADDEAETTTDVETSGAYQELTAGEESSGDSDQGLRPEDLSKNSFWWQENNSKLSWTDTPASPTPSANSSILDSTRDEDTSVWESSSATSSPPCPSPSVIIVDTEDPPHVISISDDPEEVIVISDDNDHTVAPSPPLRELDDFWHSAFRDDGNTSDTLSWEDPRPIRKRRRGLMHEGPFQGQLKITAKVIKLSPIPRLIATRFWDESTPDRETIHKGE